MCEICEKEIEALKTSLEVRPTRTFGTCPDCGAPGRLWERGEMRGGDGAETPEFDCTGFALIPDDWDPTDPRD